MGQEKDGSSSQAKAEEKTISEADRIKIDDLTHVENKKISLNSDETVEFQLFSKIIHSKRHMEKLKRKAMEEALRKANVVRYTPVIEEGLTTQQVQKRQKDGLTNKTPKTYTKSFGRIIFDNCFTYFNVLMLVLAIVMGLKGKVVYTDYLFCYIVGLNLLIGIIEEIHAKRITDKMKLIVSAKTLVTREGEKKEIEQDDLVLDDIFTLKPGAQIPADAIVLSGMMEVNESLQTGESKPVSKKKGSRLLAGSFVISGEAICQVDSVGEDTFSGKLALQAKKHQRNTSVLYRTINKFITIISFVVIPVGGLMAYFNYQGLVSSMGEGIDTVELAVSKTCASMIGMIPAGLVLLTSVALTVGVIKLAKQNTLVHDIYSIERLARVNCLCFDKTGTLTDGTLKVEETIKVSEAFDDKKIVGNYLAAVNSDNPTGKALKELYPDEKDLSVSKVIPFSSERKFSSVSFKEEGTFFLGAPEYLIDLNACPLADKIRQKQEAGYRVISLVKETEHGNELEMIFVISDHIRDSAVQTIKWFNDNGVQIKVISGDSPLTVSEIAGKCGIIGADKYVSLEGVNVHETKKMADKFTVFGRVSPEQKAALIASLKEKGKSVAMTGDGINDILAMKQADCAIAMANGADAARSAAHVVLMNSDFGSMPDIVKEGRRVVNNIQTSSSLFIMKTLFNISLAVLIILTGLFGYKMNYPFTTHQMFILEILPIGLDAFVLGLQPNTKVIKGNFGWEVFKRAIPGAVVMVGCVLTLMILEKNGYGEASKYSDPKELEAVYTSLMVLCVDTAAFIYLLFLCLPFNLYRSLVYVLSLAVFVVSIILLPEKFSGMTLSSLTTNMWVFYGVAMAIGAIVIGGCIGIDKLVSAQLAKKKAQQAAAEEAALKA